MPRLDTTNFEYFKELALGKEEDQPASQFCFIDVPKYPKLKTDKALKKCKFGLELFRCIRDHWFQTKQKVDRKFTFYNLIASLRFNLFRQVLAHPNKERELSPKHLLKRREDKKYLRMQKCYFQQYILSKNKLDIPLNDSVSYMKKWGDFKTHSLNQHKKCKKLNQRLFQFLEHSKFITTQSK